MKPLLTVMKLDGKVVLFTSTSYRGLYCAPMEGLMLIDLRKRTTFSLLLFVPIVMLAACSHQLGRSQAADLIKGDPEWSKPVNMSTRIGGIAYAGSDVSFERKLQSLGYVQVHGPLSGNYYTYIVSMTAKGNEIVRTGGWSLAPTGERAFLGGPAPPPTPEILNIPLGTLHLLEVTGIVGDDKKATAEIAMQLDCNDIAKELGCAPEKKSTKRDFTRYDDGWRLDPVKQ